jgi:hypothetical protein
LRVKKKKPYKPNVVPSGDRIFSIILGFGLIAYGVVGLMTARLNLSGRRVRLPVLEGGSAWLMSAAFIVGAVVLFSVVLDHYDSRNNEKYYKGFRWFSIRLGWCLAAAALLSHLYMSFTK